MLHADVHDSLDKYHSVILVNCGPSKRGHSTYYRVFAPIPLDGALIFANISMHASKICSRRYNHDLQAVQVRADNGDSPEAIAHSLGIFHFNDAQKIVASVLS